MADLSVSQTAKAGSAIEEEEERKLKAKYPGLGKQGVGSLMLQKRLNRGKAGSAIEEEEERKLKAKYPGLGKQGVGSLMLQKRLNRGKAGSAIEEEEERKLKAKYPGLGKQGVGSLMLQKRLNRGHKYFDSGDYNMARAKILQQNTHVLPPQTEEAILHDSTGETMATPDSVPAVRKKSMVITTLGDACNPMAVAGLQTSPGGPHSPSGVDGMNQVGEQQSSMLDHTLSTAPSGSS